MEIVFGILGLIIAGLTWRVTRLQTKLNEKEFRYKDFDRNFSAQQKLEKYIRKIVGGRLTLNDTIEFDEEIRDFEYVFNEEINEFAMRVKSFGTELALLNDTISMFPNTGMTQQDFDDRKKYMTKKSDLIKKAFIELQSDLTNIFNPILMVKN